MTAVWIIGLAALGVLGLPTLICGLIWFMRRGERRSDRPDPPNPNKVSRRIPGKMQKRIWIREDDVVLVEPWDWQDEKADITWRYEKPDADQLREEGHIQE